MADPDFPDIYGDSVAVSSGPYGLAITVYLSEPVADDPFQRTVGRIRMSVDLAEAMTELLQKSIASARKRRAVPAAVKRPRKETAK